MSWTLADIRRKVRLVTGRESTEELSNTRLDDYINDYYQFTFPAEVKIDKEFTFYRFNTEANEQEYTFPATLYTNIVPPFRVNGFEMEWYQSPAKYYRRFPNSYASIAIGTGDDTETTFTDTLNSIPILEGSVIVTDNVETFTDNLDGTLTGSEGGTGTINYTTGALSVTFFTPPVTGVSVDASWQAYDVGMPQAVLFYDGKFTLNPIPDTVYRCEIQAFQIVTALTAATDKPSLEEWGPAIAYGAARAIFADAGQNDRYQETELLYREQLGYIMTRTTQNLSNTSANRSF